MTNVQTKLTKTIQNKHVFYIYIYTKRSETCGLIISTNSVNFIFPINFKRKILKIVQDY